MGLWRLTHANFKVHPAEGGVVLVAIEIGSDQGPQRIEFFVRPEQAMTVGRELADAGKIAQETGGRPPVN